MSSKTPFRRDLAERRWPPDLIEKIKFSLSISVGRARHLALENCDSVRFR